MYWPASLYSLNREFFLHIAHCKQDAFLGTIGQFKLCSKQTKCNNLHQPSLDGLGKYLIILSLLTIAYFNHGHASSYLVCAPKPRLVTCHVLVCDCWPASFYSAFCGSIQTLLFHFLSCCSGCYQILQPDLPFAQKFEFELPTTRCL